MADFDPDAYLAATQPTPTATPDFNPDEYLKATEPKKTGVEAATAYGQEQGAPSVPEMKKMYSDLPESVRNPLDAAAETISGFIPKTPSEIAGFVTPVVGGVDSVKKLGDVLFGGKTVEQAFPESQTLVEAEKTPPFSKERYKAGFGTLANLGMGAIIGRGLLKPPPPPTGLSETLGFQKPEEPLPTAAELTPEIAATNEALSKLEQPTTPEGVPNASEIQSTTTSDGGLRTRSEVGQLPEGNVQPTDARLRSDLGEEATQARQGTEAQPQTQAPIVPEAETATSVTDHPTVEVPLSQITLSKDVPQFKAGANEKGVVEPIAGKYERVGTAPVQIWQRNDGSMELISGRHRLDLAQRTGEQTIPAQIHRESEGFNATAAARLDAELNIRDNQGSTADYANYFKNSEVSQGDAEARGLLARAKGKAGFEIARNGSEDLFALHQSGRLTDAQAERIASAAPGNAGAQQVGIKAALEGKSADFAGNLIKAAMSRTEGGAQTGDLFAFDDTAMRQMEEQAKRASEEQRSIREQISAVSGASKKPEVARKLGVDVKDPASVQAKVAELKAELARWEQWPTQPDLVARTRGEPASTGSGPVSETVYHGTPAGKISQFKESEGGIYFTSNPELAQSYTQHRGLWLSKSKTPEVHAATLDLKNPLVIDAQGTRHDNIPVPWQEWKQKVFGNLPKNAVSIRDAANYAKEHGYDGLIVRNVIDTLDPESRVKSDVHVAFSPEQVKLQSDTGTQPVEPKLLPGEKQGDLISSTQQEPFALAGEKLEAPTPEKPVQPEVAADHPDLFEQQASDWTEATKPETLQPESPARTNLGAKRTPQVISDAGEKVWKDAKATPDEFTGVDATNLSDADRRELAGRGLSFSTDRKNRIIATYPQKLRAQDLRAKVTGRQKTEGGFLGATSGTFKSIAIKVRRALDAATGQRSERLQKSFAESERAHKEIRRVAPTIRIQNAMSVWREAGGDVNLLKTWEANAKQKWMRDMARDAQNLTPEQIAVTQKAAAAFDVLERRGRNYDILGAHRDNYVPHVWDVSKKFTGIGSSKLQDRFKFNKARTFDTFFDGDQAGFKPKSAALGQLLPAYMSEMNKVIADRQFVQDVSDKTASDGRPLVVPRGNAKTVDTTDYIVRNADGSPLPRFRKAVYDTQADAQAALQPGQIIEKRPSSSALVNPRGFAKAEDAQGNPIDTRDYKVLDQPALNDWRWIETDPQGGTTILKSDLAVHPELAKRLNAMTGQSAIRQWYNEPSTGLAVIPKAIVKGFDVGQSVMKREMFGLLAPFHQVQEGTHAVGHTVNPFSGIPNVERPTPEMSDAMRYTMLLPDKTPAQSYMEGLGGRGSFISQAARFLGEKAGSNVVGKALRSVSDAIDGYQDFLFHKYIPGLKFKTYQHILERNMARYADDLKRGHVTESDVKALSGTQTDAAYGHLNYAQLDRNPTMQHIMQLTMLAPDFLEARARFSGQALKTLAGEKAGAEQFRAIAILAATQAGVMYTLSKTLGGEWDAKHPFEMTVKGRRYMLRSVPEDLHRLFAQGPDIRREFVSARMNPTLQKIDQLRTGLNYRGEKTGPVETMTELLANYIPITARSIPGIRSLTETSRNNPVSPLEQLSGSLGLKISRYSPITKTHQLASEWMDKKGIAKDKGSYPISKFQQLRYALEDGDLDRAGKEWEKLASAKGADKSKLAKGFQQSITHPFTGSAASDVEFANSLKQSDRMIYDHAKEVRKGILNKFHAIYGGPTSKSRKNSGASPYVTP